MTTATTETATHLVQTDTRRETNIGYDENGWILDEFWPDDYLYLRKKVYYKHLDDLDAGKKNGPSWYNGSYFTYVENRNLIEQYANRLELNRFQRERATSFFLAQNLSKWGVDKRFVAWAICAYIVHSDESDIRNCHPACGEDHIETAFQDLVEALGMPERQRHRLYGKVQNKFTNSRWGEGYINRRLLSWVEAQDGL